MPFRSLVTATADGVGPQGTKPEGRGEVSAQDAEVSQPPGRPPGTDEHGETTAADRSDLEATIASLEADRDRLLAERAELRERYEQLLREEQRRTPAATAPADDGLLLRIVRRFGLR